MLEDETFDDFFGKLSEIRNSMINLGKKVSDTKIIRKVMRSLPERFKMKVTAIESCTDLETMRIEELVGALQTYEFSLSNLGIIRILPLEFLERTLMSYLMRNQMMRNLPW
jgi:hypothetical protein